MTRTEKLQALLRRAAAHAPESLRREIESALARPAHRPRTIDRAKVRRLAATLGPSEIAARLKVTRQAIHRILREMQPQ